jgi:hypothetical protein
MALSKKHLKDVCVLGGNAAGMSKQCAYLDEDIDDQGNVIYVCKKLSPDRQTIDEELDDFFKDMKKNGHDPTKQGVPLGDNCKGYIVLKTKEQGYDVKN